MPKPQASGGCLPTSEQILFLKACLSEPAEAVPAWEKWHAFEPLDDLDGATFHLLPLLYRNLQRAGYEKPPMPRLKGLYRRNWYSNQTRFHALEQLLVQFEARGIPALLLKGSALSFLCYPDPYSRAMLDGDILVPIEKVAAAMRHLADNGWRAKTRLTASGIHRAHGCCFLNKDGQELDLHWHLFHETGDDNDDVVFWRRAIPMTFRSTPARTLSLTDHLFHACIHGYEWNRLNPMRWIADASLIFAKSGGVIEWDYMLEEARRRRFTLRLRDGLSFLAERCGVAVPAPVLADLRARAVSRLERNERNVLTREGALNRYPLHQFIWPTLRCWYLHRRHTVRRKSFDANRDFSPRVFCNLPRQF